MVAADWLGAWIDGAHLADEAVRGYAEAFARSPARAVVLRGLLHAPVAAALTELLDRDAEFAVGYGVYTRYGFVPPEEFEATDAGQRFFRYGTLARVGGAGVRGRGFQAFRDLSVALGDARFRGLFEAIAGMRLGDVTLSARRMRRGDFLARHTDDIGERLLSWVIYLSPGWEPRFGGALLLEDGAGGHVRVEPEYNSMVVFDARTWHRIAPFEEAMGERARLTLGGWYLRPDASAG